MVNSRMREKALGTVSYRIVTFAVILASIFSAINENFEPTESVEPPVEGVKVVRSPWRRLALFNVVAHVRKESTGRRNNRSENSSRQLKGDKKCMARTCEECQHLTSCVWTENVCNKQVASNATITYSCNPEGNSEESACLGMSSCKTCLEASLKFDIKNISCSWNGTTCSQVDKGKAKFPCDSDIKPSPISCSNAKNCSECGKLAASGKDFSCLWDMKQKDPCYEGNKTTGVANWSEICNPSQSTISPDAKDEPDATSTASGHAVWLMLLLVGLVTTCWCFGGFFFKSRVEKVAETLVVPVRNSGVYQELYVPLPFGEKTMEPFGQLTSILFNRPTRETHDDDEWGWEDENGDVELQNHSRHKKDELAIRETRESIPKSNEWHLPSREKKSPPTHKTRLSGKNMIVDAPSLAVGTDQGSMAPGYTSPPSLGKPLSAKKLLVPPPADEDDIFAEMGLSAKPSFGKVGNITSAPSIGFGPPASASNMTSVAAPSSMISKAATISSAADWDDDADLDDLLKD